MSDDQAAHTVPAAQSQAASVQLAQAIEQCADIVLITNRHGQIEYANPAFSRQTGYESAEILGKTPSILKSGEHSDEFYKALWSTILKGDVFRGVVLNRTKAGCLYYEEKIITPLKDAQGAITHFVSTGRDITSHVRMQQVLSESEARYRDLVENANDIIYTHDLAGRITSINLAGERLLGYSRAEIANLTLGQLVAPACMPAVRSAIDAIRAGSHTGPTETTILAKDGSPILVEANAQVILENGVPVAIQGVARDITQRKLLEDRLRQAQKMEAVGRLAGGVAHDFNNILTAILGLSDLMLEQASPGPNYREDLLEIKAAAEQAAGLTRQLLAFSRRQVLAPKVLDINSAIATLRKLLVRIIGEDITLEVNAAPDLAPVRIDPSQMEQVLLNLVINARDAMPGGGRIVIRTANIDAVAPDSQHCEMGPAGDFALLEVRDSGDGISPEVLPHLFEPFFTTKAEGAGTGLGLATVLGIVSQGGGHVRVWSAPNQGTTFHVYLPRAIPSHTQAAQTTPRESPSGGAETILLVEDDLLVRDLAQRQLKHFGYKVHEAPNAREALELVPSLANHPLDLLVTDIVMPGMPGTELATALAALRPGLRVLFISGYTGSEPTRRFLAQPGTHFLPKPFRSDDLRQKVRAALDGPPWVG